jgi:hypothetical protein
MDAYMDNIDEIERLAKEKGLNLNEYKIVDAFKKGLYFGFTDNVKGMVLKTIFDKKIAEMIANKSLEKIYTKATNRIINFQDTSVE